MFSGGSMKNKYSMRKQLTFFAGLMLFLSTTILVGLLFYNFYVSLSGFQIEIEGKLVDFTFVDGLEEHLLFIGIFVDVMTTLLGMAITYWWLGKVLKPLEDLAVHMDKSNKENIIQEATIESSVKEFDSLIHSFNGLSRKLKESFETQKKFSSYVAHEFRTPLAVMQTKLDVYKKNPERNTEDLILNFTNQIQKLSELVNSILNLSGIQKIELKELVPIPLLLEEVMDDLEDRAQKKNIKMELKNSNIDFSIQVIGNHELLYQAFFNIVENAIKYNVINGKIFISVKEYGQSIIVRIQDTGYGIQQEENEKIFNMFYRCNQEKLKNIQGNGIGLPFAKKVFEHHGGTIHLVDCEQGTCFEIQLKKYGEKI